MSTLVESINQLLPQTQCRECGYNGCEPYAAAMAAQQANINLCPPGGVETVAALAQLLNKPMVALAKPARAAQVALIDENSCIGCTKCIQACPVDAIVGMAKHMHTILPDICTGCELCIPPCPVDCITLLPMATLSLAQKQKQKQQNKTRFMARNQRLQSIKKNNTTNEVKLNNLDDKQLVIQAALLRTQAKRAKRPYKN